MVLHSGLRLEYPAYTTENSEAREFFLAGYYTSTAVDCHNKHLFGDCRIKLVKAIIIESRGTIAHEKKK